MRKEIKKKFIFWVGILGLYDETRWLVNGISTVTNLGYFIAMGKGDEEVDLQSFLM